MSDPLRADTVAEGPGARLAALALQRCGQAEPDAAALSALDQQAAASGDGDWLLARIAALQAQAATAADDDDDDDVCWMDPQRRHGPAEALRRIKTICAIYPDLYSAMLAVQLSHGSVSRELLAQAIKQFRRDAEALSLDDLQGLMTAALNGGSQGFEAVLRTRKGSERKASPLPWGRDGD